MIDYRVNFKEENIDNTSVKKNELARLICNGSERNHKYILNKIRDRSNPFNDQFREIYRFHCVYCGVSVPINKKSDYEVDHFIPEKQIKQNDNPHIIDNLVSSCKICNSNKRKFEIFDDYQFLLHPDNSEILNIFSRDRHYTIVINEDYKDDEIIFEFYKQLRLDRLEIQLNHLLAETRKIIEYCDQKTDSKKHQLVAGKLRLLYQELLENRNRNF